MGAILIVIFIGKRMVDRRKKLQSHESFVSQSHCSSTMYMISINSVAVVKDFLWLILSAVSWAETRYQKSRDCDCTATAKNELELDFLWLESSYIREDFLSFHSRSRSQSFFLWDLFLTLTLALSRVSRCLGRHINTARQFVVSQINK